MHLLYKQTHQTIIAIYYSSIKGVNVAELADQNTVTHRAVSKTMHWIYRYVLILTNRMVQNVFMNYSSLQ